MIGRSDLNKIILDSLEEVKGETFNDIAPITLLGAGALLNSFELVSLLVDIETRLHEEWDITITIADEKAMSQQHSPFRSGENLMEYVLALVSETEQSKSG